MTGMLPAHTPACFLIWRALVKLLSGLSRAQQGQALSDVAAHTPAGLPHMPGHRPTAAQFLGLPRSRLGISEIDNQLQYVFITRVLRVSPSVGSALQDMLHNLDVQHHASYDHKRSCCTFLHTISGFLVCVMSFIAAGSEVPGYFGQSMHVFVVSLLIENRKAGAFLASTC